MLKKRNWKKSILLWISTIVFVETGKKLSTLKFILSFCFQHLKTYNLYNYLKKKLDFIFTVENFCVYVSQMSRKKHRIYCLIFGFS